jgi:hypothetical protein
MSGTHFVSLENVSVCQRFDHFSQIWRYKAQIHILKFFAEYYFGFILFVFVFLLF